MSHYYAKFINISSDTTDIIVRNDTRIYFVSGDYHVDDGNCIGAVICKNPGSAKYKTLGEWAPLNLDKDRTLPILKSLFEKAASSVNFKFNRGDYLQVYNLFLICSADLDKALKIKNDFSGNPDLLYEKVRGDLPFYFFAWGFNLKNEKEIFIKKNPLKGRHHFYLEKMPTNYEIKVGYPAPSSRAKHPQGMPHTLVQTYIGNILRNRV